MGPEQVLPHWVSGPGSNDNEVPPHIPQSSRIGASLSNGVISKALVGWGLTPITENILEP